MSHGSESRTGVTKMSHEDELQMGVAKWSRKDKLRRGGHENKKVIDIPKGVRKLKIMYEINM